MKTNVHCPSKSLTVFLLAINGCASWATGFRSPDEDAFATARGEAFVATADNPSAVYYNPAGITQLDGSNFRGGLYGIYLDPSFQPFGSDATYDNRDNLHAVPQLYYTYSSKNCPLSFGVGMFAPYGLGLRWPQDTGFRTISTKSSLMYMSLNPVIAYKVLPTLSVAAGFTLNYAQILLRQGLVWPSQDFDNFRFRGNGWAPGYNLGVMWQPVEMFSFGASLRSQTSIALDGHTDYYNSQTFSAPGLTVPAFPSQRASASANMNFPLIAIGGVSFRPTKKWNFEFDVDYANWNSMQTVTIRQSSGFGALIPQNIPVVLNWQDSYYYELGGTRYLDGGWRVSAGYIYNENSVPDAHYTPAVADLTRHFFSVGLGRTVGKWDFDVAYQFGYGPTQDVTGSAPSAIGQTADGRYSFISHAVAVSVGLSF